jgi:hypothetical protein
VVDADAIGGTDRAKARRPEGPREGEIAMGGHTIAEVSWRRMTVRKPGGFRVESGSDPVLALAATVAIDAMTD